MFDSQDFLYDGRGAFLVRSCVYTFRMFTDESESYVRKSSGLPMKRKFLVQIFAVKKEGSDQYRSVIFPADRAMESALFCEKWHIDESDVLKRILPGTADVAEVLGQAQSIEGCLMKLELTDSEATLLGWRPELLDD